jgi:hypothetical protein
MGSTRGALRRRLLMSITATLLSASSLFVACAAPATRPSPTDAGGAAKRFIVTVEGRNYWMDHEGRPARFGFSTLRDVVARDGQQARAIAVREVRDDETLNASLLNPPDDPPRVNATHHVEVESSDSVPRREFQYIFYRDRDSD